MNDPTPELTSACDKIVAETQRLLVNRKIPILVAVDGPSGSGKSTLAHMIADRLGAALVQSDDFSIGIARTTQNAFNQRHQGSMMNAASTAIRKCRDHSGGPFGADCIH